MNNARRAILTKVCDSLADLQEEIASVRDDEEEAMGNMPESLQGSERYDRMEEATGVLDEANDLFDELIDKLKEIDGVG